MIILKKNVPLVFTLLLCGNFYAQNLKLHVFSAIENETKVLDSIGYRKTFINYNTLKAEVDTLDIKLKQLGYINNSVAFINKKDSLYTWRFELNQPVKRITLRCLNNCNRLRLDGLEFNFTNGEVTLPFRALKPTLNLLTSNLVTDGQPFSTIKLTNIKLRNYTNMIADISISGNQKRFVNDIVIKGYDKFPKAFLKYFLKLRKGMLFNLETITKRLDALNGLPFANGLKPPEVLFTKDSTKLYVYVNKIATNNFDGFLGFGTNEITNRLEFDGYLNLQLVNNLNFGERLNIIYKSDEIEQQTFNIDIDLPYVFKAPIGIEVGLNLFRKDSTFINATQYAKLNYIINTNQKVSVTVEGTNSSNLLEDSSDNLATDYQNTNYSFGYTYNLPQYDNVLFPINFWFNIKAGFGKRNTIDNSVSQTRYQIDTYKIFNFNAKNSVYTRLKGMLLNSDTYFDNELFRFGGINSIRGFEENSIVAHLYGVLNTEYRYKISSNLYVHSVIDAAYFENNITTTQQNLFGFGLGFGLLTKSGLLRFNYATAKTENTPIRLSDSKIHISLTARF